MKYDVIIIDAIDYKSKPTTQPGSKDLSQDPWVMYACDLHICIIFNLLSLFPRNKPTDLN